MSNRERTFIAVKPDGVQRGLVHDVLKRFEQRGYKLVAMKMIPSDELLTKHYAEHVGKPFFEPLKAYMRSGPVVAMVWEGTEIIKASRSMLGATKPLESQPGTLRGDFCIDVGRNLVHGSDSLTSAEREINLWFKPEEICQWNRSLDPWSYEK
ncbi:unnamed protein product [Soboliphyme baturini]|uniref:Nucleoside diphosphate kinase n=1 Tax=Soboliphyme baturini TaxID=241478 RepID=A0A183IAZ8_9BILA|nr:unnamed protein product [Soboliphyme baturini]